MPDPGTPPQLWQLPMAFVSDGFRVGLFSDSAALAAQLRRAGIRSVALEIDELTLDQARAFDRAGLDVVLWGVGSAGDHRGTIAALRGVADGYLLQIEDDAEYSAAVAKLEAGVGAGLPRAVVTTFEGANTGRNGQPLYPERMQRLKDDGVTTAFVECYERDGHADLSTMKWQSQIYGWPRFVPVIGLYAGARLSDYPQLDAFGQEWSFWRTEQIDPADWKVLEGRASR